MNRSHSTLSAVREVTALLLAGYKRSTKYLNHRFVVKGTRRHKPRANERTVEIVLTVGSPNWNERKFIKLAKKAGVSFPIRRIQLKNWPDKRKW